MEDQELKKRKVEEVAAHYNSRTDPGEDARLNSKILNLRQFNNLIKSLLVTKVTRDLVKYVGKDYPISVLELAGGKGGDLKKWNAANVKNVVLADIALQSVNDARIRYNQLKLGFHATFIAGDCWKSGLLDRLDPEMRFDIVSCQFALHYSFETEQQAISAISNISSRLKPGGYFIATIPDANYIVKRIRATEGLKFGNEFFSVEFEQKEKFSGFGCQYLFSLQDAVEKCPEFLINIRVLERLFRPYEIELIHNIDHSGSFQQIDSYSSFHEFYKRHASNPAYATILQSLLQKIRLSPAEWEVAQFYAICIFKKKGNLMKQKAYPGPSEVKEEEIINLIK